MYIQVAVTVLEMNGSLRSSLYACPSSHAIPLEPYSTKKIFSRSAEYFVLGINAIQVCIVNIQ